MDNNNYNDNYNNGYNNDSSNNNYSGGDYLPPESDGSSYDNNQNGSSQYDGAAYNSNQYSSYDADGYGMNNPYNNPYSGNPYGGSAYGNNMYGQGQPPVDKSGKEIPNNFGMKLTFSILEIFTCTLFGILGLVFTIQQNTAYKNGEWEAFKSKRKLSNIMLWIGFGFTMLWLIVFIVLMVGIFSFKDEFISALDDNDYSYDYDYDDYDYDDIDDYDYDGSSDSDYPTGDSTLQLETPEDITIGGVAVTIPTDVKSFLSATGITMEENLEASKLDGNYDDMYYFSDDYNNYSLIDIYNTSENEDYAINGYVGGIKLDYEEAGTPSFEWRGLTEQSSIQDMYDKLGNPDDAVDYDESTEFTYYGGAGWVEFEFDDDGKMLSFWMTDYESLQGSYQ